MCDVFVSGYTIASILDYSGDFLLGGSGGGRQGGGRETLEMIILEIAIEGPN